jgi:hypothetical protein
LPPDDDHPPTLYVSEDAILRHLDPWIESFADSAWLEAGQQEDLSTSAKRAGLQNELREIDAKIANLMRALEEGGGEVGVVLDQLQRRMAEREVLKAKIDRSSPPVTRRTRAEIEAIVEELGWVASLLTEAEPQERASVYSDLGLRLV